MVKKPLDDQDQAMLDRFIKDGWDEESTRENLPLIKRLFPVPCPHGDRVWLEWCWNVSGRVVENEESVASYVLKDLPRAGDWVQQFWCPSCKMLGAERR